jgi:hypothetical protein
MGGTTREFLVPDNPETGLSGTFLFEVFEIKMLKAVKDWRSVPQGRRRASAGRQIHSLGRESWEPGRPMPETPAGVTEGFDCDTDTESDADFAPVVWPDNSRGNHLGTRSFRAFPPALAGLASGGSALRGAK